MASLTRRFAILAVVIAMASACGGSSATALDTESGEANDDAAGIRLVSAVDGAAIQDDPPDDLVILDVRTAEEFAEGHLEGATMLDFYRPDFADQLAQLDPDVPYLLYCRSGNRSGQTATVLEELGFSDVAEIDGGILSWTASSLPTVN